MEQFGWTEEELYFGNSIRRIRYISEYNSAKSKGEKYRQDQERLKQHSKPGAIIR